MGQNRSGRIRCKCRNITWEEVEVRATGPRGFVGRPIGHPSIERVKEHPAAPADAGLSIPQRIPGNADTGREICVVGVIPTARRARITRHQETEWGSRKLHGLPAGHNAETIAMGIGFRGGVFVAKSVGYRETRRGFPLILGENGVLFLMLVARS